MAKLLPQRTTLKPEFNADRADLMRRMIAQKCATTQDEPRPDWMYRSPKHL